MCVYYYLDVMASCGVSFYLGNSLELASLLLNYFPRHKFISKMPEMMKPVCLWHLGDDSEPDWCGSSQRGSYAMQEDIQMRLLAGRWEPSSSAGYKQGFK